MHAAKPLLSTKAPVRPFIRNRAVVLLATATTAAAVAFKFKSDAYRNNEHAQRTFKAPNGYVSVDRSGGGI